VTGAVVRDCLERLGEVRVAVGLDLGEGDRNRSYRVARRGDEETNGEQTGGRKQPDGGEHDTP
jgi:hypothetical protein